MAKKIGAIVSLSIIGILILTTIIMANVSVDYSVECAKPTSVFVLYNSNDPNKVREIKAPNSETVINLINDASKEKALTALFNGNINKEAKLNLVSSAGTSVPTTSGFYVIYNYENKQKVEDDNGNAVYYDELIFTVNNVEGTALVKVYLIPDATKSMTYTHCFDLDANFKGLFDFLVEKEYNK